MPHNPPPLQEPSKDASPGPGPRFVQYYIIVVSLFLSISVHTGAKYYHYITGRRAPVQVLVWVLHDCFSSPLYENLLY